MTDPRRDLVADMGASFERLQMIVADVHPTEEADPAKAEVIAALKRELESLRSGIEESSVPSAGDRRKSGRLGSPCGFGTRRSHSVG